MATTSDAGDRRLRAAIVASGLAYAVGALAAPQVDGPPVETATATQIRGFLGANDTALRASALGTVAAAVLATVFAAALAALVRRRLTGSAYPELILAGGVLIAVWHWVTAAVTGTTLVQSLDGTDLAAVDDATLRSWYAAGNIAHLFGDFSMIGIGITMGTASLAALRIRFVPRWIAIVGLVAAACGLLGMAGLAVAWLPLADVWFGGIFGWFAWVLAVSVAIGLRLVRERRRAPVTEPLQA